MDPADQSKLRAIRNCPDCNTMIRDYDGESLLLQPNWIKRAWKAHLYKDHFLSGGHG